MNFRMATMYDSNIAHVSGKGTIVAKMFLTSRLMSREYCLQCHCSFNLSGSFLLLSSSKTAKVGSVHKQPVCDISYELCQHFHNIFHLWYLAQSFHSMNFSIWFIYVSLSVIMHSVILQYMFYVDRISLYLQRH